MSKRRGQFGARLIRGIRALFTGHRTRLKAELAARKARRAEFRNRPIQRLLRIMEAAGKVKQRVAAAAGTPPAGLASRRTPNTGQSPEDLQDLTPGELYRRAEREATAASVRVYQEAGIDIPRNLERALSSSQRSHFDSWLDGHEFVPDRLVRQKGFVIYDEMLENDGEVKNAFSLKRFALLSPGWEVLAAEAESEADQKKADELREFVLWVLQHMEHSFESFVEKLLDAFRQGFKLAEEVYRTIDEGPWKGKWGLRKLFVRNSRWYRFDCNDAGEILPDGIIEIPTGHYDPDAYVNSPVPENSKRLPRSKFVLFTHGATDDSGESLYGRSDFRAGYRYYWSNLALQKIENAWLERWSDPLRWAEYPIGYTETQRTALMNALEEMGRTAGSTFPEGGKVTVQGTAAGGGHRSPFRDAIESNNGAIARAMLVGDLVQSRGEVGSFALGKMHFTTFLLVVQAIAQDLAWSLNEQLIRPLIDLNFPDHRGLYPRIMFQAANTDDAKVKAEILQILVNARLVDVREEWTREFVGIPPMDPDLQALRDKEREDREKAFLGAGEGEDPPGKPGEKGEGDDGQGDERKPPAKELGEAFGGHLIFRRQLLAVEQKIDYAQVEGMLWTLRARTADEVSAAFEKLFGSLHAQVRRKKILEEKKRLEAANLRVDTTALARAIYRGAARHYLQGKVDAISEINKQLVLMGEEPIEDERDYVDARDVSDRLGVDLTAEQERLSAAMKVTEAELEAFADRTMAFVQGNAQKMAAGIQAELGAALLTGIENGWDAAKTSGVIDAEVKRRWISVERELGAGVGPTVDTLQNAAYNEGRVQLYEQASKYVEALVYSAILDDKTTDFCRRHDGFIAKRDDPVWSKIIPPNHYGCRSIIGAVLRGERYDVTPKPSGDPAPGFDRIGFDPLAGVKKGAA